MATSKGSVIGNRYEIVGELGFGSFGRVYLVKDRKTKDEEEELKALKEVSVGSVAIANPLASDTLHEAALHKTLDHPCVVHFFDSFFIGDRFYMCTEYCEGGDLSEKIDSYRKAGMVIPEDTIMEWFIQILLGLHYIHQKAILHRDIKPGNIMLNHGTLKITDFGISKVQQATLAHTCIGTPHYMSPEAVNYDGYNDKSDVWAVGVIVYEMAALKVPFDGVTMFEVFKKISTVTLPKWPKGYSDDLKKVYMSIMQKDPKKRPSTLGLHQDPHVRRHMESYNDRLDETFSTMKSEGQTVRPGPSKQASPSKKAFAVKQQDSTDGSNKLDIKVFQIRIDDPTTRDLENIAKFLQKCRQDDTLTYQPLDDDTLTGVYSHNQMDDKISSIRTHTETILGKRQFNKAFLFLKSARSAQGSVSEATIDTKMAELVPDKDTREHLHHLHYLEMQKHSQ